MAAQIILVLAAALFQATDFFSLLGVKPNLALAVLISLAFFVKDWRFYAIIVLAAAFILKPVPGWDWDAAIMPTSVFAAYFIKNFFPWQPWLNNFVLLVGITFILGFSGGALIYELFYNLTLGGVFFYIFKRSYG